MNDTMNEITAFSTSGGRLVLEVVKGVLDSARVPENTIDTQAGNDRDMYVYVPSSGCPDAKQTQVVVFLRDGSDAESAEQTMTMYGLDKLAEREHFVLVFPNSRKDGWNYTDDLSREDDMAYLLRCFMALPRSQGGVGGFLGMISYIAGSPSASAMLLTLSAKKPVNVASIMISDLPADYTIPQDGVNGPQVAFVCGRNAQAERYLENVNNVSVLDAKQSGSATVYTSRKNPNIRHMVSDCTLSAHEIAFAWDKLFCKARRWSNDTYGTYQKRTNFAERGFVAHVNDISLGVNNGFAHTWYEYVPPQLRGSAQKVPLLFYFHGVGCVPLYGAEQSDWHEIADRENFIVVYPKPSLHKAWNVWNEPSQPSDHDFVLALIDHMKQTYSIDETRLYISGFSMGGMMTNSMVSAYPERFAAAAPCNGFHVGYLMNASDMWVKLKVMDPSRSAPEGPFEEIPRTRRISDEKKSAYDYRMPIIQNSGLLDGKWPLPQDDGMKTRGTFDYWKKYNNIPLTPYEPFSSHESGLTADETFYDCEDERFLHHRWFSQDEGRPSLYEVVLAKRMPHALDLRQLELAWQFMKKFSRHQDGTLGIAE